MNTLVRMQSPLAFLYLLAPIYEFITLIKIRGYGKAITITIIRILIIIIIMIPQPVRQPCLYVPCLALFVPCGVSVK